jgi:hypothetical protein
MLTSFFSSLVCIVVCVALILASPTQAFTSQASLASPSSTTTNIGVPSKSSHDSSRRSTRLLMAQVSEAEGKKGIDKVVAALRKDKTAISELGRLEKVNNVLGYGSPRAGTVAVRFNASFKKGGSGLSSVPLPFGMGQSNKSEGRGTMVGQVKASVDAKTGKILECSVFRDLGYGRAFNLKV